MSWSSDDFDCGDGGSQPLVINNATYLMRAGFAGDDAPRAVFPTVVGRPRHAPIMVGMAQKDGYVGDEAYAKCGILRYWYPMKDGIITNFKDMEKVWQHTFWNELRIQPEEHSILFTEKPFAPKENKKKTTQLMFETFNVPAFYIEKDCVLALFGYGKSNGIVLDSGHTVTHCSLIYEGYFLKNASNVIPVGGNHLTDYFMKLYANKYSFTTTAEREIARDIKEKHCYVASNYELELKKAPSAYETKYELPDGQIITVSDEAFKCTEALFKPMLIDKTCAGIHELLYGSIVKLANFDIDILKTLKNVVLNGGNTMFKGLPNRLQYEINNSFIEYDKMLLNGYLRKNYSSAMYKDINDVLYNYMSTKININAIPERKYAVWIGGSVFAYLSTFWNWCINKDDYDEVGPGIVYRKFF